MSTTSNIVLHSCPDCSECTPRPVFAWCSVCGLHIDSGNGACEHCTAAAEADFARR